MSQFTLIEYVPNRGQHIKFVVFGCPTDQNTHEYAKLLKIRNITEIIKVSDKNYSRDAFDQHGITINDGFIYPDGQFPNKELIGRWLSYVVTKFTNKDVPAIGIHCDAGLGRAPVLVAIALIHCCGMKPMNAITYIRSSIKYAFNRPQLLGLINYHNSDGCCIVA